MPRRPRRWQWTEEACYHLMDRGHNRETIFSDDHQINDKWINGG